MAWFPPFFVRREGGFLSCDPIHWTTTRASPIHSAEGAIILNWSLSVNNGEVNSKMANSNSK
jgi:hypothetical protein